MKKDEAEQQTIIDKEKEIRSKLDQNINNKQEQHEKNVEKIEQIKTELEMVGNDKMHTELNERIKIAEKEIKEQQEDLIDNENIKEYMALLDVEREEVKQEEIKLDRKLDRLMIRNQQQTHLKLLLNEKKSKNEQIKRIRIHCSDDLEEFFVNKPNNNTRKYYSYYKTLYFIIFDYIKFNIIIASNIC